MSGIDKYKPQGIETEISSWKSNKLRGNLPNLKLVKRKHLVHLPAKSAINKVKYGTKMVLLFITDQIY